MENAGPSADPFLSSDRYARDGQRGLSKLKDTQRLVHTVPSNRLAQAPSPFGMPWARHVWTPCLWVSCLWVRFPRVCCYRFR